MNKEDIINHNFIVVDGTDIICIGGFGNLKGNLSLLNYSEEEISNMIKENNNTEDNIRLAISLLKSIKELQQESQQLKENNLSMQEEMCRSWKKLNIIKELRTWLEEEKDRLARECSQIYEDSLGKTRLVNEDIFNEVNIIISKLNELEEGNSEKIIKK